MKYVYFRMTDNCPFPCRHCCYENGPGGYTMSRTDIERVVENLSGIGTLHISGGEVFTVLPSLKHLLSYIGDRRKRVLRYQGEIMVQTSGYWITNKDTTLRLCRELYELGMDSLDVSGGDVWHEEQGVKLTNISLHSMNPLREAVLALRAEGKLLQVHPRGTSVINVAPIGRGRLLPQTLAYECSVGHDLHAMDYSVSISPRGDVYPCVWQKSAPIGSVLTTPLDEIVLNATKVDWVRELTERGPRGVAQKYSYRGNTALSDCELCDDMFSGKSGQIKVISA